MLRELAEQLQRDVRDDLDVHPRVVVDLHAEDGVDIRRVPPALELPVAVDAFEQRPQLPVPADRHVDPHLLDGLYEEPELTIITAEVLQAITSHRDYGKPLTIEAGIVRVADALDMAKGRSRIPFERGSVSIHSLSAAAIDDVEIKDGEHRPILIEILMNNSSGIYQVDGLLKAKLRGSGLEPYVEVVAHIDTEAEKKLVPLYRLEI